jgi:transcriptional regulator with GAF, ATPase, and Fis domain
MRPNDKSSVRNKKELNKEAIGRDSSLKNPEELIQFERLVANLSAKFVNLPTSDVDRELEKGLKLIVDYLGVDRSAIMQFSNDQSALKWTHFYGTGIKEKPKNFDISSEHPWFTGKLRRGESVVICSPGDIEDEGVLERNWMIKVGMKSNLTIPLAGGGSILGGIAFSSFSKTCTWPSEVVNRLRLVGEVFANALMRKRSDIKLDKALQKIRVLKDQLHKENIYLKEEIKARREHQEIIGQSSAIMKVLDQAEQVAGTKSTVLVLGETGTGKELLTKAIHELSPRGKRALVKVNCATLPTNLVEAELFGREKGAYTGALTQEVGRFEVADGSTIFLDEICELEIGLQAKLLRILQEGQFERLGSTKTIKVDVRIIAATNRDLNKAVREGRFREDLYYRLNVFPIMIPPLRERREDVPLLLWAFIKEFEDTMGKTIETVPKQSMDFLMSYRWPGNIRELRNVIERAMILSKEGVLNIVKPHDTQNSDFVDITFKDINNKNLGDMTYKEAERSHILKVLEKTGWRIRGKDGAAEILDLKPSTLESKMAKLKIKRIK